MNNNPQKILDDSPMNAFQKMAVAICLFLNALDGFDVLAISFASPGIAAEWQIDRAALGIVLSIELVGMAVGSISLGRLADRIGRRPTMLGCLFVMTSGMALSAMADSVNALSVIRFITGLGIGGILASVNAMVSEYANKRSRNLSVSLMALGYPLGAVVGGSIASILLASYDWRSVFIFGAVMTGIALLITFFFLPESIHNLANRRPPDAMERINRTLAKMGHPKIDSLPPVTVEDSDNKGFKQLFSPAFIQITVILTFVYFAHIMTFYYLLKWIPKVVVDMGFSAALAGSILVYTNIGGATGSLLVGLAATKYSLKKLTIGILVLSFLSVACFGLGQGSLVALSTICVIAGFFTTAGVVTLYALFAQYFPPAIRASGTGFVIGVGRAGAALGPIAAGYLFTAGFGLTSVSIMLALGALIGAFVVAFLPKLN